MSKKLLIALAGLVLLLPGCLIAAAAGAGVLIGQEVMEDNTCIGHVRADANTVWARVKVSLARMSTKPIDANNDLRSASADVRGATVKVTVETFDLNVSKVRVSARKYGLASGEDAQLAFDRLIEDLNQL